MRRARPLAAALLATALLAGCGSDDDPATTATGPMPEATGENPPAETSGGPSGIKVTKCDSSAVGARDLQVSGKPSCSDGRRTMNAWIGSDRCTRALDSGRAFCRINGYFCFSPTTDRGIEVNCGRPNESISFTFRKNGTSPPT